MKTKLPSHSSERGTILFVVLVATAILAAALASYLRLVSTQNYSVARSQSWNRAIPILEAGIEEAMAQINKDSSAASLISNGWQLVGTTYVKTSAVDGENYTVKIALLAFPIIQSQGFAKIPLSQSDYVSRTVRVKTRRTSLYTKGLTAQGVIDLMGNNVTADSFNSSDPTASVSGMYSSTVRRANGDIATNGQLINVGNADIYGHLSTGPGGTNTISSNGSVGDLAWHAAGSLGIQAGHASDDMNVEFPPVSAPYLVGLPPASGTVGGTNYSYVLSGSNTQYSMSSLSISGNGSNNQMLVTGNVTLYVSGNVSLSGSASIVIAPGASLRLFVAGSTTSLGGGGVVNNTGYAANFSYFGLPTNTSVSYSGNASYVGTMYAPNAALSLGGGGNNTYDFVGASVSRTVQMNGHFNFHYDEDLGRPTADGYYVISSWNEL